MTGMDKVEAAGNALASKINAQFQLSAQATIPVYVSDLLVLCDAQVAAIDLNAVAGMNTSAKTFYAGMNERIGGLVSAADKVQAHATDARRLSSDMAVLLQKARRLEALVDRLDEYTSRQEAALSKK